MLQFTRGTLREKCPYSELSHFPAFGVNTERYTVFLRIQSECVKMREEQLRRQALFKQWNALATGCLYCLNKLTAWQVCVACIPSVSLISKSKQRLGKPHVVRSCLGTKFLKVSVLMKVLFYKSFLLTLNVSIVS